MHVLADLLGISSKVLHILREGRFMMCLESMLDGVFGQV